MLFCMIESILSICIYCFLSLEWNRNFFPPKKKEAQVPSINAYKIE